MTETIHRSAAGGYSARAETYRDARPGYPPELVDRFVERYRGGSTIELGAGTGIFTRALAERGVAVMAVEPVAEMRHELEQHVPGVQVLDGTAERIPVGDAEAATVLAAQAFHWFDHAVALDEIARVLVPGGHLVTAWNVRDLSVPWVAAVTEIIERHAGDTPRHVSMVWRRAIEGDARFELADDWHCDHPVATDADGVVARTLSTSFIGALDGGEQARVVADVRAVVEPLGDRFDYPYRAELQAWRFVGPEATGAGT
ncbi:MAG: class I SAM-dependent methyltransferase [Ilumatobacter sp.]|uniref:class I SAM-dependent methyltransferase n=1 Tax=Ilumatobacter sp. TaxID=1967498 RepID=UPI00261090ED|nr:class I SAM-dependent methyltransferase [Ilumatobacter sp.]MDJ0768930.1 class I SAM-dependent methyltransferase [Ilumatobacter sp.]